MAERRAGEPTSGGSGTCPAGARVCQLAIPDCKGSAGRTSIGKTGCTTWLKYKSSSADLATPSGNAGSSITRTSRPLPFPSPLADADAAASGTAASASVCRASGKLDGPACAPYEKGSGSSAG